MKSKYSAMEIDKWFIYEVEPEPLKLQKLLYLSQGFSYSFYDRPLFDDDMEAQVRGPVVPSVYHTYKSFSYNPIITDYQIENFDEETLEILNYVKDNFSKYDAKYLEEMTHNQEPWILSREGLNPDERSDKTICKQNIDNYFINYLHQPDIGVGLT